MFHSPSTPSKWVSTFISTTGQAWWGWLINHKHLPLKRFQAITFVNTINGLSMSNVKSSLPERQWLDEMVFCDLAERELFWKVTLSANIVACEICPKKELIICLLSQNSPFSIMLRFSAKLTHTVLGSLPARWSTQEAVQQAEDAPRGGCGVSAAGVRLPHARRKKLCGQLVKAH